MENLRLSVHGQGLKTEIEVFWRYKQNANVSEINGNVNTSRTFIKLPDTAFGTIFSNLYQNRLQPVTRYQYVDNSCVLVIVPSSETCTLKPGAGHNVEGALPINDTCDFKEHNKQTWLALDPTTMSELYNSDDTNLKNSTVSKMYKVLSVRHNITEDGVSDVIGSCIEDSKYNSNCSVINSSINKYSLFKSIIVVHNNSRNWMYYNISSGSDNTTPDSYFDQKNINFDVIFGLLSQRTYCSGNNTLGADLRDEVGRWIGVLYPHLLSDFDQVFSYDDQVKNTYSITSISSSCKKVIRRDPGDDVRTIDAKVEELETNTISNLTPTNTVAGAVTNMLSTLLALAAIIYAIPSVFSTSAKQIITSLVASMSITLALAIILINEREARSDNSKALFVGPIEITHESRSCQNVSTKYITFVNQSLPGNRAVYVILGIALAMCICVAAVTVSRLLIPMCRRTNVIPHV